MVSLVTNNGIAVVINSMKAFKEETEMMSSGYHILSVVCFKNEYCTIALEKDVMSLIDCTAQDYMSEKDLIGHCLRFCNRMAQSVEIASAMTTTPCVAIVFEAIRRYSDDEVIMNECVMCLIKMLEAKLDVREIMDAGVLISIVEAMQNFTESDLPENVCLFLVYLLKDKDARQQLIEQLERLPGVALDQRRSKAPGDGLRGPAADGAAVLHRDPLALSGVGGDLFQLLMERAGVAAEHLGQPGDRRRIDFFTDAAAPLLNAGPALPGEVPVVALERVEHFNHGPPGLELFDITPALIEPRPVDQHRKSGRKGVVQKIGRLGEGVALFAARRLTELPQKGAVPQPDHLEVGQEGRCAQGVEKGPRRHLGAHFGAFDDLQRLGGFGGSSPEFGGQFPGPGLDGEIIVARNQEELRHGDRPACPAPSR